MTKRKTPKVLPGFVRVREIMNDINVQLPISRIRRATEYPEYILIEIEDDRADGGVYTVKARLCDG